jgi:hypothetical protein
VAFVSLSNVAHDGVEDFVESADIPWSCGYGASAKDLVQFGAYSPDRMGGNCIPGYEAFPTLYLISPDGRVLWNDRQARALHIKSGAELVQELDAEIEHLLEDREGDE